MLLAAAPTSQPAEPQIRAWFAQLADSDGAVRDKAVENLMGIRADDLPLLRKIVEQTRPLLPSQKVVLRDIVTQVFLTSVPYPAGNDPFLGLSWLKDEAIDPFRFAPGQDVPEPAKPEPGILITRRVIGFDAYRTIRDGDVISAIQDGNNNDIEVRSKDFADIVKLFHPGQTLTLRVIRDGRPITTQVLLRAKPTELEGLNPPIDGWLAEREHLAEEYWKKQFSDLVGEELS